MIVSSHGHGFPPDPTDEIESWLYTGTGVPPGGDGNARINLWLLKGDPPTDEQEVEVIVQAFEFSPCGAGARDWACIPGGGD